MLSTRGRVLSAGSAAAAIAGLVYGVEEFVLLATSVWILLAVGAVTSRSRRRALRGALRVVVRVPLLEVAAGQSAVVELHVTNTGGHRLPPVVVEDAGRHWSVSFPGLGAHLGRAVTSGAVSASGDVSGGRFDDAPGARRARRTRDRRAVAGAVRLPELGSRGHGELRVPVPTAARGLVTLAGVALWCEDPFRLFLRRVAATPPAHVVVYPHPDASRGAGTQRAGRPGTAAEAGGGVTSGDELAGLRPYAPGDRLTRLHWPSLARTGELVVREFVEPRSGSLTLMVDVRPAAHDDDSFERAVSTAAGLGIDALHRAVTVELCTSSGDRVVVTPGSAGRQTLLRALAMLGPANPSPALARRWGNRPTGAAVWATGHPGDARLVLVTTARGQAQRALPDVLGGRAETVLVP